MLFIKRFKYENKFQSTIPARRYSKYTKSIVIKSNMLGAITGFYLQNKKIQPKIVVPV